MDIHSGECLYNKHNYNWILLERNADFNLIKTEFQILFYATVVQQIILFFYFRWIDYPSANNNPITICSIIDSEIVVLYEVHTPSVRMVIVFKTFKGYSHGSAELTISYDPDCIGWNYMSTLSLQCFQKTGWYHLKDCTNEKIYSPTCSDFCLTHYVTDILNPSELENCIFSFNECGFGLDYCSLKNKLRLTVAPF